MTENIEAIIRQLKFMEARFGTIGTRLNSIDLRIGNIESCVKCDEPNVSVIAAQSEYSEPRVKRLKPSCQSDVDISAETVTSSTTIRSVETPVEDNDPDERNIATSKGKVSSDSLSPFGYIHPAVRKRDRNDYEKETLNVNTATRMYNIIYQSLNPNAALSPLRFVRFNPNVRCPHTARQLWRLHDDDVKELLDCLDVEVPEDAESRKNLLADLIGIKPS